MTIEIVLVFVYMVIGAILADYWFKHEHAAEYNNDIEDGMVGIMMMVLTVIWPLKLLYNLIMFKKI